MAGRDALDKDWVDANIVYLKNRLGSWLPHAELSRLLRVVSDIDGRLLADMRRVQARRESAGASPSRYTGTSTSSYSISCSRNAIGLPDGVPSRKNIF